MSKNEKYLTEAHFHAKAFEEKRDPDEIETAYLALENVVLQQETDLNVSNRLRADALHLWLRLIGLVDGLLDPKFDPADVPPRNVQPPPSADGVSLPPGADPARIEDPKLRAQYEKDIAAHRANRAKYNLQVELRFQEERVLPRAKRFIRDFYTPAPRDQAELKTAIEKHLKEPQRKSDFLKLLAPGRK